MSVGLMCTVCSSADHEVSFVGNEEQRQHYKTDWHRYNLKRRLVGGVDTAVPDGSSQPGLAPVTREAFNLLMSHHLEEMQSMKQSAQRRNYCQACRKTFTTANSFSNHLQSKRHREATVNILSAANSSKQSSEQQNQTDNDDADIVVINNTPSISVTSVHTHVGDLVSNSTANDSDDDWEDIDEDGNVIKPDVDSHTTPSVTQCLFCLHTSSTLESNLVHMSQSHGFFLPDVEYVSDMIGFIAYLAEKVSLGLMCIYCNSRSKHFRSVKAVQRHMQDASHCRLAESEMFEYADFYDYSSSYEAEEIEADADDNVVNVSTLDDSGFELVLPSGKRIGHRSLMMYYQQYLDPVYQRPSQSLSHNQRLALAADSSVDANKDDAKSCFDSAVAKAKARALASRLAAHYGRVIPKGLHRPLTSGEIKQKAKDMAFMTKARQSYYMRLGVKANRMQKHFVDANMIY